MSGKRITIHDIASSLGINASTVSRALKDHPSISKATKAQVLNMAEKLNYQPNHLASALRKGKSNIVGVIIPTADRNFFSSVIRGVEDLVKQSGYRVIISQSNDSTVEEVSSIKALMESRVDGILASYAKETTEFNHFSEIVSRGIPLILFDRLNESLKSINADTVVVDDFLGAYRATEHLIEQGCIRIAHFSGPQRISIYNERLRGYIKALNDHQIAIDEALILESDLKLEAGYAMGRKLMELENRPDALFSASDYGAVGAMKIFKNHGLRIPDDMAVAGFSNESFTDFIDPSLTTVDQHPKIMGQVAAQLFLDRVDGNLTIKSPRNRVLTPELVIRNSSLKKTDITHTPRLSGTFNPGLIDHEDTSVK